MKRFCCNFSNGLVNFLDAFMCVGEALFFTKEDYRISSISTSPELVLPPFLYVLGKR